MSNEHPTRPRKTTVIKSHVLNTRYLMFMYPYYVCCACTGDCTDATALSWGLHNGQLSYDNGNMCVVRSPENFAELSPCSRAFEYIALEVPTLHT